MEQIPLFNINADFSPLVPEYNKLLLHDGKVADLLHEPRINGNPALAATVWAAAIERQQVPGIKERTRWRRKLARWVLLKSEVMPEGSTQPTTYWREALHAVEKGECDVVQLRTVLDVLHPHERINNNSVFPRVVRWKMRESILAFDLLPSERKRRVIRAAVKGYVHKQFPAITTVSPWHNTYQVIAEGHLLRRMGWVDGSDPLNKFDEAREKRFIEVFPAGRAVGEHKDLPSPIRAVLKECLGRPRIRQAAQKERRQQYWKQRMERRLEMKRKTVEITPHEFVFSWLVDYAGGRAGERRAIGKEDGQS